jgi:UDP-N-acetylmuramyl pentapeptide phosphotransferase/UDP-N-acetylglucosamine-1-phosphate transferase
MSVIYIKLANHYGILDIPNSRSSHVKPVVRGGGVLFILAILIFFLLNNFEYLYFVIGVSIISVVSFIDDLKTLSSKIRFPFQFLGVFLILYQIDLPFSPFYTFLLYLVFGIGAINMFNFMDGINGITGVYSLVVLSGFYMINIEENLINPDLLIYSIMSIVIFGYYNFRKRALFFAGDIGSIGIGMLIIFIGFLFTIKLSSPSIILLIIVYGADSGNTLLFRKIFTKESVFEPHRHHIYQKLVDVYKMPHLKVSVLYGLIQLLMNIIVYKSYKLNYELQLIIVFSIISIFIISYIIVFKLIKKHRTFN